MFRMRLQARAIAAATIVAAFILISPVNSAGAGRCVRNGERVAKTLGSAMLVERPVHDLPPWQDADRMFACSSVYGRRVNLGIYGIQADGEVSLHFEVANRRFLAFVVSSAGNAGGSIDESVQVADLSAGRLVTKTAPSSPSGAQSVEKLLVNREGWVGWTTRESDPPPGTPRVVQVHQNNLKKSRVLASGATIDRDFLRFDTDRRDLVWSSVTAGSKVVPMRLSAAEAVKSGAPCLRSGEKAVRYQSGSVLIRRPFKQAGWERRFQLIACSRLYHRRVSLGRFGTRATGPGWPHQIEPSHEALRPRVATISVRYASEDESVSREQVVVFDLATGKTLSRTWAAETASSYSVTALQANPRGSVAWIVRHAIASGTGHGEREVHLSDGDGERVLARGSQIDPFFLRFGDRTDVASLLWSAETASGRVH